MELTRDFPLFPLRLVALPTELVPLHIFEERYKILVERCLAEPTEFGILCTGDDGQPAIGCACMIAEVLERLDDGRVNLVARGTRVFRLEAEQDDLPYPAGAVEFMIDDGGEPDPELLAAAHDAYAELVREATDREPDLDEIAAMGAYQMAATIEFNVEAKQRLLELRSESARLELLLRLLRAAVRRLDFVERAQARAASNGKVRLGPGGPLD
ncbi:MAG: LON peptidase substrate-binding domain-containing protein [Solirubrobacteraceae bacterium]